MRIINLTPHDVVVRPAEGQQDIVYPKTGIRALVEMRAKEADPLPDGCPTCFMEYGPYGPISIPAEALSLAQSSDEDYAFLVSTMFATAYRDHSDAHQILVPDSGPDAIRENGQVVAVRRLIRK